MRILSNSDKNFPLVGLYFQRRPIIFPPQSPLPQALIVWGAVVSLEFSATEKGHNSPTFRPMSAMAKRVDSSGYHLARRYASAQMTLW